MYVIRCKHQLGMPIWFENFAGHIAFYSFEKKGATRFKLKTQATKAMDRLRRVHGDKPILESVVR